MSKLTESQISVLRASGYREWVYIGESKRIWERPGRWTAPRAALKKLVELGLLEVRTVTVANWLCDPRIEDRQGAWVEAKATAQGLDVRRSLVGLGIDAEIYPWTRSHSP